MVTLTKVYQKVFIIISRRLAANLGWKTGIRIWFNVIIIFQKAQIKL